MEQHWTVKAAPRAAVDSLILHSGVSPLLARCLVVRGVDTPAKAGDFLAPSLERDWHDPLTLPDMAWALDTLEAAIRADKRILVFGDFDLDGISSTALMLRALRALGNEASHVIPNRAGEGYGLTQAALERVFELAPELVVTVDCGVSSAPEVEQLLARGIDVVVTDHHEPSDAVPRSVPVVNPKLGDDSPSAPLAGVGVALKLIAGLGARFNKPALWLDLTDLAALGTIADLMPLLGENRALVAHGLARLNHSPRSGIAATLALASQRTGTISATDLSFSLIPRLNAAGRMGDPAAALHLLLDDNPIKAHETALALEDINQQRRSVESALTETALKQAEENYHGQRVLVLAGADWHEGVRGIVASRLVSRYGVPVVIFSIVGDEARGSGRTIGSVNIFKAVEQCADLTLRFGGHEGAAGVTVQTEKLDAFRQRLESVLAAAPESDFHPPYQLDAQIDLSELNLESVAELKQLEPYGQGNREPLFVAPSVFLTNAKAVGAEKNHLSCSLSNGRTSLQAIWFHCPDPPFYCALTSAVDAVFTVQIDEWNGRRLIKLMIKELLVAQREPTNGEHTASESYVEALFAENTADEQATQSAQDAPPPQSETPEPHDLATQRSTWEARAQQGADALTAALCTEFLGQSAQLHQAQRDALQLLQQGESVLTVMATGRGKSLIFHVHAARLALQQHKASIFVYPLRALIADQAFHLSQSFMNLGLTVRMLTGESSTAERDQTFSQLASGAVDVVLTTPEFLHIHRDRFTRSGRIGFLVVDEAHHIATAKAGHRPAYRALAQTRAQYKDATALAVTATADDAAARAIQEALGSTRVVLDPTVRENLVLHDHRNLKDRETFLAHLVANGEKTVVYVNSRDQSIALARMLRKSLPHLGVSIAFYNAGLPRTDRTAVEQLFRTGALRCIVSTSAFGEGVNIPDIRQVVLFHLPFNAVEFNQMSGRGGRDGSEAGIHLLYGKGDAQINSRILESGAPRREDLVTLYRVLTAYSRQQEERAAHAGSDDDGFAEDDSALASACVKADPRCKLDASAVATGIAVFAELGLVESHGYPVARTLRVTKDAQKVELSHSSRYLEGCEESALFDQFREHALYASAEELLTQINRPILPLGLG